MTTDQNAMTPDRTQDEVLAPTPLDRDLARVQLEPIRSLAEPLLCEVIDEGVGVFVRCDRTAPDGDANLGILFPFHHLLEMADGAQILLGESGVAASHPLLRSGFEALLGLKYVLAENTETRALCYVVADLYDRLRWYDRMDPETTLGQQYRKDLDLDSKPDFPMPSPDKISEGRTRLQGVLSRSPFKEHSEEYERLRQKRQRIPHWYSLYGGPSNLRELAAETGDLDDYIILYKQWSKTTHGVDLWRQLGRHRDRATIATIRAPEGVEQRYLFAIQFVLEASRLILQHYRPGETLRYARWYQDGISGRLEQLERTNTDE